MGGSTPSDGGHDGRRLALAEVLLATIPDFVYVYSLRESRYVHSNGDLRTFLGYAAEDVAHLDDSSFAAFAGHPDEVASHLDSIARQRMLEPEESLVRRIRLRSGDGDYRWFTHTVRGLGFDDDGPTEIVGTLHDVTSIVEATQRFEESERRFRRLFEHNPSGTAVVDDDGRILEVNQALCDLLGRLPEELVGTAYDALVHHEERADVRLRRYSMAGSEDAVGRAERRFLHSDGSIRHVRVLVTRVVDAGRFVSIVSFDDVTAQLDAQRRLEHAALHDPLTGLPNRRLLMDRLDQAVARDQRTGCGVAVLFLDLDRVKAINDSHGHEAGDHVIATVARRLSACLREHDTVARHGGDEFVIVCQDVADSAEVEALAQRVLAAVRRPITWGPRTLQVTVSIGIAAAGTPCTVPDDLVRAADIAMYEAKTSGRARFALA